MAILDKAQPASGGFTKPDIAPFIPQGMEDVVARLTAAGMRLLYSPAMREEVMQAVQSDMPVPEKLGQNATGLILMLDKKAPQGIPSEAMFPAALQLLGECAEVLAAAGQPVTQDDYNEAAMHIMIELGRRLGATDEQLMQAAQQAGGGAEQPMEPEMPPEQMEMQQ